jgi:hypothetical protein
MVFAVCVALGGCTTAPAKVASTWPVATSEATATPPADAQRFPLTGLSVPAGATYAPSPISAKIIDDGSRASLVGLGSADVVYETAESDSGTQLAALFQSSVPERIGPLGSAGMPDLWILPQYHAALFSTGATASVAASIKRAGLIDMSMGSAAGDSAYTNDKPPGGPKGEYVIGPRADEQMLALGSTIASQSAQLRFSETADTTGSPTASVSIPFSENQVASWTWNSKTARYVRTRAGHSQRDAGSGERISASNVVVMWTRYSSLDADIAGSGGYDVVLGGSGQVTVFRDGQRIDGRWKADGESPPTFSTESGQAIRLAPGTTWFEVIPLSANITMR